MSRYRGWFWILVVILVAFIAVQLTDRSSSDEQKTPITTSTAPGGTLAAHPATSARSNQQPLDLPDGSYSVMGDLLCDRRIVHDAEQIIIRNDLVADPCYGTMRRGNHIEYTLGLALDLSFKNKRGIYDTSKGLALAQRLGWDWRCNSSYCTEELAAQRSPMRAIAFDGPSCGNMPPLSNQRVCITYLHLSWNHAPTQPGVAPAWVADVTNAQIG